ncbi:MAG: hypothetical protein EOP51_02285 [Sphingobacteriales bacterium]|nr:MAG: hypothetical protein EOP51_02285 [Sphingobacteriales bacterium]
MRTSHIISGILLLGVIATGCARKNEVIEPAPRAIGGLGGNNTLVVTPRHHTKDINGSVVYIKYDTLGTTTTNFDAFDTVKFVDGRPIVKFESLKAGNYYLYASGFDNDSLVSGGAGFTIVDTFENTYFLYLDVLHPGEEMK